MIGLKRRTGYVLKSGIVRTKKEPVLGARNITGKTLKSGGLKLVNTLNFTKSKYEKLTMNTRTKLGMMERGLN
jgi:hypothetical protein